VRENGFWGKVCLALVNRTDYRWFSPRLMCEGVIRWYQDFFRQTPLAQETNLSPGGSRRCLGVCAVKILLVVLFWCRSRQGLWGVGEWAGGRE